MGAFGHAEHMTTVHDADLRLARALGDLAADVALSYFRKGVLPDIKPDGTPVTEADLAVERALVDALGAERAGDTVLSEEGGGTDGDPRRRWIVDPIDGTTAFVSGRRDWGTHVALEVDGEIVLGLITRPTEQRSWWAVSGGGAWASTGQRLQVSGTSALAAARVGGYMKAESPWQAEVATSATWVACPSPILELIEGRLDAVLSEDGYAWDHAPGVVLLREAGGRFTDPRGGDRIDLRGGLYTNGHLHDALARH